MASLPAQRFRLLQKVNDLRTVAPDGSEHQLEKQERQGLLDALQREGGLTFAEIKRRKLVAVPKGYHFNLERGGEKTLPGNGTVASLRQVFGERWETMGEAQQQQAVEAWLRIEDDCGFAAIGAREFGLEGELLERWKGLQLAAGYSKLSLRALSKLLPLMEAGMPFKAAETQIYGDRYSGGQVYDRLPPVKKILPALANPAVIRALSELRQLVNAIVREYGKPYEIRIELARDLKRNAKQRADMAERMRKQQDRKKKIILQIAREAGIEAPSGRDVKIGLLWEQSKGICPYCGKAISLTQAFEAERAEVDHILPRSRFLDDSFGNKVLAHYACNQRKRGQTPFEAYGADPVAWEQVLDRVAKWDDPIKLRAFQITDAGDFDLAREDSFAARRLNDTRYATTQAARYLAALYGGRDLAMPDGSRRRAIFTSSGLATAALRNSWRLNAILGAQGLKGKSRADHRHHAVDAVVIALTSVAMVQRLSAAAAAAADVTGRERVTSVAAPWPDFVDSVRPVIESVNVSHRPVHRLRGRLHNDTNYSPAHPGQAGRVGHVRRKVQSLTKESWKKIVDAAVREAVAKKLHDVGGNAKKLENNWPVLKTRRGATVEIRKVRVVSGPSARLASIGTGPRERWVSESANHHIAIFAGRDRRRREGWAYRIVTRLEATRAWLRCRHVHGEACECVISRAWQGEGEYEFLFSLMKDDLVEMDGDAGSGRRLFVVRSFSERDFNFLEHRSAGLKAELHGTPDWLRLRSINELRERGCTKIGVDILGRVHPEGG